MRKKKDGSGTSEPAGGAEFAAVGFQIVDVEQQAGEFDVGLVEPQVFEFDVRRPITTICDAGGRCSLIALGAGHRLWKED